MPESDDIDEADIRELDRVAGLFKLPQIQTICSNVLTEQEFLNPSIGTYLNDLTGANMKQLFLNQPDIADIKFQIDGKFASNIQQPGPGCSKLTTSLVNVSLKFQTLISQTCQYICRKNLRSFCSAKAFFIFSAKISVYLVIKS